MEKTDDYHTKSRSCHRNLFRLRSGHCRAVQAPARPLADYAPLRESVLQYVSRAVEQGPDPEQVARAILRVATTPRPRLRYRVGPRSNLLVGLRQLLPASLFEGVYRRVFHLDATVIPTPSS
jgi:hypothetical protein